jgi:hypothetical protein
MLLCISQLSNVPHSRVKTSIADELEDLWMVLQAQEKKNCMHAGHAEFQS